MANTFGELFRITTWGESHGGGVGVVIDGCPAKIDLTEEDIQPDLDRRRPGQSKIVTQRKEEDKCQILSGTFEGKTLGTPISIMVHNQDMRPDAYTEMKDKYRPSHADYTYDLKYGIRNWQGGGRTSARETIGRVAAAAVAKKVLKKFCPKMEVLAYVKQVHSFIAEIDPLKVKFNEVESNILRWPTKKGSEGVIEFIDKVRSQGDTVGGVIECVVRNVPGGLGEPVFDRLEADLAKAMLSLPASKGFEIGSGFESVLMYGSEHNDIFRMKDGKVITETNNSGGIQGGISNGQPILFRTAFKPVATIMQEQLTISSSHKNTTLKAKGRHDPCVLPRAVPMVEAMTYLVLVDHFLRNKAQNG
jgi:chorismate synthase